MKIGFSVPEWGFDPYIRWKKKKGETRVDRQNHFQIVGYAYHGRVFERRDGVYSGINLTNLQPIGRLEQNIVAMPSRTKEVKKGGKLEVRPEVFWFGNVTYWRLTIRSR